RVKAIGRLAATMIGIVCCGAAVVLSLLWQWLDRQLYLLFIIIILQGAGGAALQIGITTSVGIMFMGNNEAAFANYKMWQSVGSAVTFIYSTFLCMYIKLYIMLTVIVVGTVCVLVLEVIYKRQKTR
ncbi:unnamed protein product, partial [Owenia fusiformis]